jgi:hypothetical protein
MKLIAVLSVVSFLFVHPAQLLARSPTLKIVIRGADLTDAIEIRDRKTLADFEVWSGAGTYSNEPGFDPTAPSFIIDWSEGSIAEPSRALPRYEVLFYADRHNERLVYAVLYAFDPISGEGYVYLPGKKDQSYRLNVHTIIRRVEGKWFHAWAKWDNVAEQLIEWRKREQSSTTAKRN